MELRQLRYFVAVAEELHFRRAAERLHISQPSVSEQIARLETELGVQLLIRNRRGVQLTAAGNQLLKDAPDLIARVERTAERTRAVGAGESGRLRLSLTRSTTGGVVEAIVNTFRSRHPDVQLELETANSRIHAQQLLAGELDVAFVRPPLEEEELAELELAREQLVCVVPQRHRLARQQLIRRDDLKDEPLVWWRREHGAGAWDDMLNGIYGEDHPEIKRTEPDDERIVSAVAAEAGIGFIMLARSRILRVPGAVYRRFEAPEPTVGIALAWRRDASSPAVARFRDVAAEVAGKQASAGIA